MSGSHQELVLEIVELESGELIIRDVHADSDPIIKINFSEEIRNKLSDQYLDVARIMLTAGIQMVAESGLDLAERSVQNPEPEPTLH